MSDWAVSTTMRVEEGADHRAAQQPPRRAPWNSHTPAQDWPRWLSVVVFAVAMAWVEAACVYYLRVLTDRVIPYQAQPLPLGGVLGTVELVREAATLVMLMAIGLVAARTWPRRLAYALIAFGTWDIFYYVFLRIVSGWPASLFEWDVLFLLPLPWWGPVVAPVSIALLMIAWGTLETQFSAPLTPQQPPAPRAVATTRAVWASCALGVALALYVFMADAIRLLPHGFDATTSQLPTRFEWALFLPALVLMAAPVVRGAAVAARRSQST